MQPRHAFRTLWQDPAPAITEHFVSWLVASLSLTFIFIHLYAAIYGFPDTQLMNSLHVTLALALVFLLMPTLPRGHRFQRWGRLVDATAVLGSAACLAYFLATLDTWTMRTVIFRPIDYVVSLGFVLLIFEATRRAVGMTMVVICFVFIVYALNADHFGGIFFAAPVGFTRLLQTIFLGDAGIFGIAVSVMAQYVVIFILFGSFLNAVGGGRFFTRVAFALFAHRRGGPAKAAVLSSSLMGTLSGSAIGNVVSTGTFTIPLMIRFGYRRAFAGGVEAAASNGGMIMPPVMGAVAFIMADLMGRDYVDIVMAAILPALIYYLVMFFTVDLEARKLGLEPVPKGNLPPAFALIRAQGFYLLPLGVVVLALYMNYSIVLVAVLALAVTVAIGLARQTNRLDPVRAVEVMEETTRATVGLSVTTATAGIMLGAIFASGLSYQLVQGTHGLAEEHLWAVVLMCGVLAVFMGMGMSAPAVYITLAATVVPIMTQAGISPMAAHFYAFYYGIASNITPPVALAAYAAAPIAKSSPLMTGVHASRLAISSLLLPILFIYHPAVLLEGSFVDIVVTTLTATAALMGIALALTGHLFRPMSPILRAIALAGSALLFFPGWTTDLVGALVLGLACLANRVGIFSGRETAARSEEDEAVVGPGLLARFLAGRVQKSLETEAPETIAAGAVAATAKPSHEAILETLSRPEDEIPSAFRTRLSLATAWGVTLVVIAAFHYAGSTFMHSAHPRLWALLMAGAAAFAVTGLWLALRLVRTDAVRSGAVARTE